MALHLTAAHTSIVRAPCDGGGWLQLAPTPLSGCLVIGQLVFEDGATI